MKERPILFSTEMVQAIQDGRKTQTRRVFKPFGYTPFKEKLRRLCLNIGVLKAWRPYVYEGPYGKPGDRLWVREAFCYGSAALNYDSPEFDGRPVNYDSYDEGQMCFYKATDIGCDGPWKPSIHMPRWASRINLEIIDIRFERVKDITNLDARDEGWPDAHNYSRFTMGDKPVRWFEALWDAINAPRGHAWIVNPWVWVIEFRII